LATPDSPQNYQDFPLYPGLIDSCLQFFCIRGQRLLAPASAAESGDHGTTFIPFALGRLAFNGTPPPGGRLWCRTRVRAYDPLSRGLTGDITLFADDGRVILTITDFTARKIRREQVRSRLRKNGDNWLYNVAWQPTKTRNRAAVAAEGGSWLIFADQGGVGQTLAARLLAAGEPAIMVGAGPKYAVTEEGHYQVNPGKPKDFIRLFNECYTAEQPCRGIVFLWALDSGAETTADSLAKVEFLGCGTVLHLLQALAAGKDRAGQARLWLITRGGQAVGAAEERLHAHQSLLWGLASVIRLEHPELKCTCVDLDPGQAEDSAENLGETLLRSGNEEMLARRNGLDYAARLVASPPLATGALSLAPNGTYLITGGLGALGLSTARWLAAKGAGNLVLVGRGEGTAQARQQIAALADAGVRVKVVRVDLGKRQEVARLIRVIVAEMAPLRGIVHAAGVLADGVLLRQDLAQLQKVMAPKVAGTWFLHQETRDLELDFFVCYSSIASVLGSVGQGNYAAANAFMDTLVQERRRQGLPGLSINWAGWDQGMAAGLDRHGQERLKAMGFSPITFARGFAILEQLLSADRTTACVAPVNWPTYLAHQYHGVAPGFFEAVAEKERPGGRKSDILLKLAAAPTTARRTVLFDYVRQRVATTLRFKSAEMVVADLGVFDLGVDSLMAVELKNLFESDLGVAIRPTLVFDFPTVAAITGCLAQKLNIDQGPAAANRENFGGRVISEPLDSPSGDQLEEAIIAELAKLEALLKGKN
jgi:NAD(P)-dependent dehydrogenase (short-subunit alcohol dehydrogenase family)/acyl carrier protein